MAAVSRVTLQAQVLLVDRVVAVLDILERRAVLERRVKAMLVVRVSVAQGQRHQAVAVVPERLAAMGQAARRAMVVQEQHLPLQDHLLPMLVVAVAVPIKTIAQVWVLRVAAALVVVAQAQSLIFQAQPTEQQEQQTLAEAVVVDRKAVQVDQAVLVL